MSRLLAFWLLPAAEFRSAFAEWIGKFAHRFDTPAFEPHVTVFGGKVDERHLCVDLAEAMRGVSPLELRITGISFSDQFTKTLFVTFADSAELTALSERLRALVLGPYNYELRPHLSLLYAHLPGGEKRALASEVRLPFQSACFDCVCAISGNAETESPDDVASWQMIAEARLCAD